MIKNNQNTETKFFLSDLISRIVKLIGKKIRKIALREFSDITQEDFYQGLSEDGKQKILEIAESIKLVDLIQFDDTTKKVLRSESNSLFILN